MSRYGICTGCQQDLPHLPASLCPRCALPTPDGGLCGHCLNAPPAFDTSFAALSYSGVVGQLILAAKFGGRWNLLPMLAEILLQRLPAAPNVDLIVPLPLHSHRLQERGFNQAMEIARPLAKSLHIPTHHDVLLRKRDTQQQKQLTLAARHRNLRGAFVASAAVMGKRVAVVDDVMTSGASLDAAARALKKAGAVYVETWVVARTL